MRLLLRKREQNEEGIKEFFTPSGVSLQEAKNKILGLYRKFFSPEEKQLKIVERSIERIYYFTKYFRAESRGEGREANLFDHTVRTTILLLERYAQKMSPSAYGKEGINYQRAAVMKKREIFPAILAALYHDVGKCYVQVLNFLTPDGYSFRWRPSFQKPPDVFFGEIEKEAQVEFSEFQVSYTNSLYRRSHPLYSALFFAKNLTAEEEEVLGEEIFLCIYHIQKHHELSLDAVEHPAMREFLVADQQAAAEESGKRKRIFQKEDGKEILARFRNAILDAAPFWNRPGSGIFTLADRRLLITKEFISEFDREKLADFQDVSILGVLPVVGIEWLFVSTGKVVDGKGKVRETIASGAILIDEGDIFSEGEIGTKARERLTLKAG